MPQKYLSTLPHQEQQELALCGITQDEQLLKADPQRLLAELDLAAQLLPGTTHTLTLPRLEEICRQVPQQSTQPPLPAPVRGEPPSDRNDWRVVRSKAAFRKPPNKGIDRQHAAHPMALLLASLFLLMIGVSSIGLAVLGAYAALFGEMPELPVLLLLGLYALLWVCYLLSLRRARCVICGGTMCSIFSSKRSVHAHYLPLLGHSIPAAFSILFTLRTICPHCGTLQLLIGGARPRHRKQ